METEIHSRDGDNLSISTEKSTPPLKANEIAEDLERSHSMEVRNAVDNRINEGKDKEDRTDLESKISVKDNQGVPEITEKLTNDTNVSQNDETVSPVQDTEINDPSGDRKDIEDAETMSASKENVPSAFIGSDGGVKVTDDLDGNGDKDEMIIVLEDHPENIDDVGLDSSEMTNAMSNDDEDHQDPFDGNGDKDEMIIVLEDHQENFDDVGLDSSEMTNATSNDDEDHQDPFDGNGDKDEMIIVLEDHRENVDDVDLDSSQMTNAISNDKDPENQQGTSSSKQLRGSRGMRSFKFPRIHDNKKSAKTLDDLFPNPSKEKIDIHQKKQTLDSLFPIESESDIESEASYKDNITKKMDQILFLDQSTDVSDSEQNKFEQKRTPTDIVCGVSQVKSLSTELETSEMEMIESRGSSNSGYNEENLNGIAEVTDEKFDDRSNEPVSSSHSFNNKHVDQNGPKPLLIQTPFSKPEPQNTKENPVGISSKTLQEILQNIDDDTIIELQFYEDAVITSPKHFTKNAQNVTFQSKENSGEHRTEGRRKRQKIEVGELPTWPLKVKESSAPSTSAKLGKSPTWPTGAGESPINIHFQNTIMIDSNGKNTLFLSCCFFCFVEPKPILILSKYQFWPDRDDQMV